VAVLLKLSVLASSLFWRHMMLPAWLSLLLLNFPGVLDELFILGLFVYWVGPQDVLYSVKHAYKTWVQPKLEPYIEQLVGPAVTAAKKED
jgi:hypothetical protein